MQPRISIIILAVVALATPAAATEPPDDEQSTWVLVAVGPGGVAVEAHLGEMPESGFNSWTMQEIDADFVINPSEFTGSHAMRMWSSSAMVVVYSTNCKDIIGTGMDLNEFPYVFVIIRWECLMPFFDSPVQMDGWEMEGRHWY